MTPTTFNEPLPPRLLRLSDYVAGLKERLGISDAELAASAMAIGQAGRIATGGSVGAALGTIATGLLASASVIGRLSMERGDAHPLALHLRAAIAEAGECGLPQEIIGFLAERSDELAVGLSTMVKTPLQAVGRGADAVGLPLGGLRDAIGQAGGVVEDVYWQQRTTAHSRLMDLIDGAASDVEQDVDRAQPVPLTPMPADATRVQSHRRSR